MAKTEDIGLKERVYNSIKEKILTLKLMPGDKIPEVDLAAEFKVSRPIIREAVQRLAWNGLIKLEPNKSATVIVMDGEMIQDLALVRWQLDQLAIPLAIYNSSLKDMDELKTVAMQCIEANEAGDLSGRHAFDALFHQKIYELSKNHLLYDLNARLAMPIRLWQALHITSPDMLRDGLNQHLELVDSFRCGDVKQAIRIIHDHSTMSFASDFKGKLMTPQDIVPGK